jgi:hypothetical protein
MLLINDEHIVEGIIGGLGWLLTMYQIKQILLKNASVFTSSILTWTYFWYIRKIGMNLYKHVKKRYGIEDDSLSLKSASMAPVWIFIFALGLITFYFMKDYQFVLNDAYIITGVFMLLFLLYLT